MKPEPLELWRETVSEDWIDFNGHMNVAYYMLIFDHAVDALWDHVGLGSDYRTRTSGTTFTVEAHITYDRELVGGDEARCTARILGCDEKRVHHYYEMFHGGDGYLAATVEFISLHVDLSVRKVTPFPDDIQATLAEVLKAHSGLAIPNRVGRGLHIPARK
jgi:acyl-CoA thioester hydrolase